MTPPRAPSLLVTYGSMAVLCLVWGSTWLVIKLGLRDVPPFTGAAARFLIAGACMALLVPLLSAREGGNRPPRLVVLAHGLCQFTLNYGLVYVSETILPSGMVAVLWSVFPLFIALGEHFVLRTTLLSGRHWLGIAASLAGVTTLFATDLAAVDARAVPMGLVFLLAPLSVAFSTLFTKRRASGASSLALNRDGMLIGAVLLGAVAFVREAPAQQVWTTPALLSVLYLALAGTVLTFGVYMWLLRYVAAYRLSVISFVTPVVALFVGAVFGGEAVGAKTLLGTLMVLGGCALVLRRPSLARTNE